MGDDHSFTWKLLTKVSSFSFFFLFFFSFCQSKKSQSFEKKDVHTITTNEWSFLFSVLPELYTYYFFRQSWWIHKQFFWTYRFFSTQAQVKQFSHTRAWFRLYSLFGSLCCVSFFKFWQFCFITISNPGDSACTRTFCWVAHCQGLCNSRIKARQKMTLFR